MNCTLCPRKCNIDRSKKLGACGLDDGCYVARASLHMWEEPPISGTSGSGAIFFSNCNLRCVFCQNSTISRRINGRRLDENELAREMLRLMEAGAHNINLVSPTPHVKTIIKALKLSKKMGLTIPIVYNTNGYETVQTLAALNGLIDIYLPDLKYVSSELSSRFSGAADYFEHAAKAVPEMWRQVGTLTLDDSGIAKKGLIIRHLLLPNCVDEARNVLDFISNELPKDTFISLMSQYVPMAEAVSTPPLDRRVTKREYERALSYALSLGFTNIFTQKFSSQTSDYTPDFSVYSE